MTFQQWMQKNNGKYLEVAGSANAMFQCVDAANGYIRDVLELPIIEWTNAVDFPSKADKNKYDYILNTPTNIPKEGDIVVWKPSPGHIAVFIEGNIDTFKSFDQNFPVGSPCHIQNHNYTNVTGWLRCKQPPQVTTEALIQCQTQLTQEIKNKNDLYNEKVELLNDIDGLKSQIQHYTGFESQLATTLNCEVDEAVILGEITKLINNSDQLRQTLADNQTLKSSEANLTAELAQEKERAANCLIQNKTLAEANTVSKRSILELEWQLKRTQQVYIPLFEFLGIIICKRK